MLHSDPLLLAGAVFVAGAVLLLAVSAILSRRGSGGDAAPLADPDAELVQADDVDEAEAIPDGGHAIDLPRPVVRSPRFGLVSVLWGLYSHYRKRKKVGKEGYVQWFIVDDGWPSPIYVKPESKAGGLPEYEYNGKTYLFPRQGRLPDSTTGMWTVVHSKDDAIPLNIDVSGRPTLDPRVLNEYATMRPSASPPSVLDRLDLDPQTIFYVGLAGLLLLTGLSNFL